MDCVALITARGGSKGIPDKNIKALAGKPMIAWTIEAARACPRIRRVIISTDSDSIAAVARRFGGEVPFRRPAELAQDDSTHISVVEHALRWLEEHEQDCPDYLLLLQPTSPLRTREDIEESLTIAARNSADAVVSVTEARPHPYLMRAIAEDGTLRGYLSLDRTYARRQDAPAAYALNGAIYLIRRAVFLSERTFQPQRTYPHVMPLERSIDVDDLWDFKMAECILREQHGSKVD